MAQNINAPAISADLLAAEPFNNLGEPCRIPAYKLYVGAAGVNGGPVSSTNPLPVYKGGTSTVSVPTGAGSTTIKPSAGRLCNVLITTVGSGTGNVQFTDGASGTVIFQFINTAAVNTFYEINMPAATSIICVNVASGPVMTVSYS